MHRPAPPTSPFPPTNTHGGEVLRLARERGCSPSAINDFSSNANSLCKDLTQILLEKIPYTHQYYPDAGCTELRHVLAAHENVSPQEILIGNGSSENIFLSIMQCAPRKVLLVAPIFSEYARACEAHAIPYELLTCSPQNDFACTKEELQRLHASTADMVILCSPNNPAGICYPNIQKIIEAVSAPYLLIDNTYREFLWGTQAYKENSIPKYRQWAQKNTEIISVQSFTKFFYCTGVRLGYSIASEALTNSFANAKPPWTVSDFAEKSGLAFMEHIEWYRARLPQLREHTQNFIKALADTGVFSPEKLFAGVNFVCCGLKNPEQAKTVYTSLLRQQILVRLCDNIPGMPQGFFRIQVRSPQDWPPLLKALHSFV